jgi:predicted Zn-dependent protease
MRKLTLAIISLCIFVTGCSVNPVTGERNLNFMSEEWEQKVGAEMYAPMRQSQGGDFILDPELTSYVQAVGDRLAAQAKRDLPYEFHILNDSVPNAWALPGGKIVVNRGLLTELESEAELAAVLGHEIVHADAAHGARGQSKGIFTQVGAVAGMIYLGSKTDSRAGAQAAQIVPMLGAQLISQKYGRDAEREADFYGMQYLSAAGYDPQGAVELQRTFLKLSEGRRSDWLSGLFASHPASRERVLNNQETARSLPAGGERHAGIYQQKMARLKRLGPAYEAHDKGRKALAEDKSAEARKFADEALRLAPAEALFHTLSGDIAASENNYRKAEQAYTAALQRDNGFFYHHLRRGMARHELERYDGARQDLESSMNLLPTAQAHYLLGRLDMRAGDRESAIAHFDAAKSSNSEAGVNSNRELARINPLQYLQVQGAMDQSGKAYAVLENGAPLTIGEITLLVTYVDDNGQRQEFSKLVNQKLEAGKSANIPLGLDGYKTRTELNQRLRVTASSARAVE